MFFQVRTGGQGAAALILAELNVVDSAQSTPTLRTGKRDVMVTPIDVGRPDPSTFGADYLLPHPGKFEVPGGAELLDEARRHLEPAGQQGPAPTSPRSAPGRTSTATCGSSTAANSGVPMADLCAVMYGMSALLAALHERTRTGRGRQLDVSIRDCLAHRMTVRLGPFHHAGLTDVQDQRAMFLRRAGYGVFTCAERKARRGRGHRGPLLRPPRPSPGPDRLGGPALVGLPRTQPGRRRDQHRDRRRTGRPRRRTGPANLDEGRGPGRPRPHPAEALDASPTTSPPPKRAPFTPGRSR